MRAWFRAFATKSTLSIGLVAGLATSTIDRKLMMRAPGYHFVWQFIRWCDKLVFVAKSSFGDRFRRTRWSAAVTVLEPVGLISLLSIIRYMSGHPIWQDALLHTTGVLPYYIFYHVSLRVRASYLVATSPHVTRFELILSHTLAEIFAKLIVGSLLCLIFWWMGASETFPNNPLGCFAAIFFLCLFGIAIGLLNSFVSFFIPGWMYFFAFIARAGLIFSGLAMTPNEIPFLMRPYFYYNPFFQAITWFRVSWYVNYPTIMLDVTYFIAVTLTVFVVAILVEDNSSGFRSR